MKLVILLQCNKVAGNSCSRLGTNRGRCGMVVGMSISRRLTAIALAGALTLGGTTAANAQENPVEKLTSDRKSTRLNSSHVSISYAVFCLKKKKEHKILPLE